MLCGWKGNRKSVVALAMRHRLSGLSTYRLNSHRKGDEHPAYAPVGYGTFTFTFTWSETNSTDRNLFFFEKQHLVDCGKLKCMAVDITSVVVFT